MNKKIALIGLGYTSQIIHLKNILYSKKCELTTIYDDRSLLRKKIQKKYNIKNCLNNLDQLKNLKHDVDLVVLCVERSRQQVYLEKISKFGYDVLTEKPFSINSNISKKILRNFKEKNKNCLVSFMKVHDPASLKFREILKKKTFQEGYFISKSFGGDLRNGSFWRIKTNEKLFNKKEVDYVNKKISKKNRVSYLIFLNRFLHSINLIIFLFDIKLKRLKDINLKKINKYSYNLTFNFKNIYFNLSFGDSKQNTWIEEYKLITRDNAFNLKLNSPFNIQSCGELKIENNKSLRTYNNSKFKFKWAYQNQFEYFLKNHKKKNIINQISDCVNQQLLLEKIWIKIN